MTGTIATKHSIIRHNEEYERLVLEVLDLVQLEQIDKIVLGYPKNMNNTIGYKGELSLEFKKMLEQKINIPILLQDERLTTKEAENILISNHTRRKKRKQVIDSLAATIILQEYLDKEKKKYE